MERERSSSINHNEMEREREGDSFGKWRLEEFQSSITPPTWSHLQNAEREIGVEVKSLYR
jgi:hypothetical protein